MSSALVAREHVWLDGRVLLSDDTAIAPFTHALHYGSGVFEGIRAYKTSTGSAVFRLREHIERLFRSAAVYGLTIDHSAEELEEAVIATLRANGYVDGYIRPLVFYGQAGISLAPKRHNPTHVLVALRPLRGSLVPGGGGGARLTLSPWQKTPSRSMPSTAKACGNYLNSILALQDAADRGFDEALLLNDRGEVAEGTGENIFIVKDGVLRTNDETADVLDGITRATAIELAGTFGIPVEIGPVTLDAFRDADEAFMTGTAAEVMPISALDDLTFPAARPITDRLRATYGRIVHGEEPAYERWLTRY